MGVGGGGLISGHKLIWTRGDRSEVTLEWLYSGQEYTEQSRVFVRLTCYPNSGIIGVQYKHSDPGRAKLSPYDAFLPDFLLIILPKRINLPSSRFCLVTQLKRNVAWRYKNVCEGDYKKIKTERKNIRATPSCSLPILFQMQSLRYPKE